MLSALLRACQESTYVNTKLHLCLSQLSSTSFSQGREPHGSFLDFWMPHVLSRHLTGAPAIPLLRAQAILRGRQGWWYWELTVGRKTQRRS